MLIPTFTFAFTQQCPPIHTATLDADSHRDRETSHLMRMKTLIDVLQTAHWTHIVDSQWKERGGIMLVAPPASLKTTFINTLEGAHDSLILSDINVQSIVRLRDDIVNGRFNTLAFTEYEKLYQRHPQVALNVEGHIKSFVEEGFRTASFEDARMPGMKAKCLVIGGMTPSCFRKHYERWIEEGFSRRFLWAHYKLLDGNMIVNAIHEWKKIDIETTAIFQLKNKRIPYSLTPAESAKLRGINKYQSGQETPFALLKKIAVVMKQRNEILGEPKNSFMHTLEDFAEALSQDGAELIL